MWKINVCIWYLQQILFSVYGYKVGKIFVTKKHKKRVKTCTTAPSGGQRVE